MKLNLLPILYIRKGTSRETWGSLSTAPRSVDARVRCLTTWTEKKGPRDDLLYEASRRPGPPSRQERQFWLQNWSLSTLNQRWWIWRLSYITLYLGLDGLGLQGWCFIATKLTCVIHKVSKPSVRVDWVLDTVLGKRNTKLNKTCTLPLKGSQTNGWNKCWAKLFP